MRSFAFAWDGLCYLVASEHNARVHLAATVIVFGVGLALAVSRLEALFLVFATGLVWFAEAMNTAVERLADAVTLEHHPQIKIAKDVSAAAVLVASIVSVVVGLIIIVPPIASLLR